MWQQSNDDFTSKGNVPDSEKKYFEDTTATSGQQDSGIVDSGFLSSEGNLLISSDRSGEINESFVGGYDAAKYGGSGSGGCGADDGGAPTIFRGSSSGQTEAVAPEPMRADSGLDLALSESLNQLSLEQINLNPLGRGKVQTEPTFELRPLSVKIEDAKNQQEHEQRTQLSEQFQQFSQEPWELYYTQDDDGDTQLHIAIVQGFLEAAFSLIRMAPHPCLLNILNDDCQAPLHLAVLTRQPRIARRLVLAGANPALRDFRGNTALHLACASGDIACAKALTDSLSTIERNCLANSKRIPALPQNLEQRNYDGEMCLHVAAAGDQVDLVQHLLRLGADLEAREGLSGRTALHLALERGCRSVVTFLLQECRPCLDAPTYGGITAYQIAICFDGQLARELVRLGAKPEPLPESDSDMSDDSGDEDSPYIPAIARLRQGVGVRA